MSRELLCLTWNDFDRAVQQITAQFAGKVAAVYGQPRGGLPLAVSISHHLNISMVYEIHGTDILWVDDIVDTGKTFNQIMSVIPKLQCAAWVCRGQHQVFAPVILDSNQWVVFPWELESSAQTEAVNYVLSR